MSNLFLVLLFLHGSLQLVSIFPSVSMRPDVMNVQVAEVIDEDGAVCHEGKIASKICRTLFVWLSSVIIVSSLH